MTEGNKALKRDRDQRLEEGVSHFAGDINVWARVLQ